MTRGVSSRYTAAGAEICTCGFRSCDKMPLPLCQPLLALARREEDEVHRSLLEEEPYKGKLHGRRLFRAKSRGRSCTRTGLAALALVLFAVLYAARQVFLSVAMAGLSHKHAAWAMSLGAGMATGVGATFVLCTTTLNRTLLASTMSFSSGVMIYVSLVEVITVADEYFRKSYSAPTAYALATLSFFVGVVIMAAVDRLVHAAFDRVAAAAQKSAAHGGDASSTSLSGSAVAPLDGGVTTPEGSAPSVADEEEGLCEGSGLGHAHARGHAHAHAHAYAHEDESAASILALAQVPEKRRLLMMAAVVSAAIVLHNIPEGMATYVASFHSVSAGLPVRAPRTVKEPASRPARARRAHDGGERNGPLDRLRLVSPQLAIAIAIHNIPEGLAIAMPVYYATGSRRRAILFGTLSGFSEPFGAVLASLVANESSSSGSFGGMFGLTAGMMTYVCLSELLVREPACALPAAGDPPGAGHARKTEHRSVAPRSCSQRRTRSRASLARRSRWPSSSAAP